MNSRAEVSIEIGPKSYRLRALNKKDFDELTLYLRKQVIKSAFEVTEGLPQSQRDAVIAAATAQSRQVAFQARSGQDMMQSPENLTRLVYQCLINPGVTQAQFHDEAMEHQEDFLLAAKMFSELNQSSQQQAPNETALG